MFKGDSYTLNLPAYPEAIKNIATYRPPTDIVVVPMIYPRITPHHQILRWRKRSPVRSNEIRMRISLSDSKEMGYEPAFQALAKQTMVAKIHGGAARRRLMVVLNPRVAVNLWGEGIS